MDDSIGVQLLHSRTNLFHYSSHLDLRHWFASLELLIQLTSHGYFEYDINVLFIIEAAVHFDDIWVIQIHLYFDFSDKLIYDLFFYE